ncbi:hypothetical protein PHYPSEUDO_005324 [Phytophthora pseudosyringae]|uniref:Uncharacterized protein n=1 Tax=Phytophthora pseudosyringae TaxID=221518 RepID=A0A8T1VPB0_9STRA|nr:hypothetical protein PHYPSEUDO_005324 [Phytophthora pseudosyringae]
MLTLSALEFADVVDIVNNVWDVEDRKEQKRRLHRIEMVQFRRKRKEKQQDLRGECHRLEEQVKQAATRAKAVAARGSSHNGAPDTLRELFVEIEDLRHQNGALRKQLGRFKAFQHALLEAAQECDRQQEEPILPTVDENSGWRVYFSGGEPSFYFHPFSRDAFDTVIDTCTASLALEPPAMNLGGEFLGWSVLHATVTSAVDGHALVAKSRFTKRLRCSLLEVADAMSKEDRNSWPVIVTPLNWGGTTGRARTEVLQEFDNNTCVLVHNVQDTRGSNLRYICLVRRHRWTEREGQRVITYTMRLADSEANKRSRIAEANDDDLQWITEGGAQLTIVEIEDGVVDVMYDHWGGCESALHAQYLFVQWAHYALRFEQMVVPAKLLPAERTT